MVRTVLILEEIENLRKNNKDVCNLRSLYLNGIALINMKLSQASLKCDTKVYRSVLLLIYRNQRCN